MSLRSFSLKLIQSLSELYSEMDRQTTEFRNATGLNCPPGCGQCCESETPETTVIELLPVAEELFVRGESERWLERIDAIGENARCVFFQPDPSIPGNGQCQLYRFRPSICRLFAFAAMKNKEGKLELQTCRRQKEQMPHLVQAAQEAISKGMVVPSFDYFFLKMVAFDPLFIRHKVPINRALRLALEKYGLIVELMEAEG